MKRLLVLLAACGSQAATRAPISNTAAHAGGACPSADRVVLLRWDHGWHAYLSNRSLDDAPASTDYEVIPTAEAHRALPSAIWIDGCRATVTHAFRAYTSEGPVSEQIGVELDGCAPKTDEAFVTYGLIGDEDLSACRWTLVETAGLRVGEVGDRWKPPTKFTPIPAEVAPIIAHKDCKAPACEHLWQVGAVGVEPTYAYDVVQTWLQPADKDPCSLEYENGADVFVRVNDALAAIPDTGNDALAGVFHDGGGAKLVVLEDSGTFDVVTVAPGLTQKRHTVWYDANEETSNYRSLAPYCGP